MPWPEPARRLTWRREKFAWIGWKSYGTNTPNCSSTSCVGRGPTFDRWGVIWPCAGTGAVMSALVRLAIGEFTLATALDSGLFDERNAGGALLPPELAVRGLIRQCVLNGAELGRVAQGLAVSLPSETDEQLAALDPQGRLVAVLERREEGMYAAFKNFPLA